MLQMNSTYDLIDDDKTISDMDINDHTNSISNNENNNNENESNVKNDFNSDLLQIKLILSFFIYQFFYVIYKCYIIFDFIYNKNSTM